MFAQNPLELKTNLNIFIKSAGPRPWLYIDLKAEQLMYHHNIRNIIRCKKWACGISVLYGVIC